MSLSEGKQFLRCSWLLIGNDMEWPYLRIGQNLALPDGWNNCPAIPVSLVGHEGFDSAISELKVSIQQPN